MLIKGRSWPGRCKDCSQTKAITPFQTCYCPICPRHPFVETVRFSYRYLAELEERAKDLDSRLRPIKWGQEWGWKVKCNRYQSKWNTSVKRNMNRELPSPWINAHKRFYFGSTVRFSGLAEASGKENNL